MSCTLKEHYQKIHNLNYTNDQLNKVCIKVKPAIGSDDGRVSPTTTQHDLEGVDEDEIIAGQAIIISTDTSNITHLKSETDSGSLDINSLQLTYTSLTSVNSADELRFTTDVQKFEK